MIYVKCKSIYRCMSRAKCQKSLRDFDKLKQSLQIDFAAALDLCVLFVCAVLLFHLWFLWGANRFIDARLGRSAQNPLPWYESVLKNIRMRRNMFSTYQHAMIANHPCRSHWAKAHRAQVASPTTFSILDSGEFTEWTVNVTSPRQFKSRYVC